jgi:hypothetical protein
MMKWALSNLWKGGDEGGYVVRHGHRPVRDYGTSSNSQGEENQSNYFEEAFPCLFPYGVGGIESEREVNVDFLDHVRWALQYHDRRFRKHETFPFLAFGISQRRQALNSARVQMQRRDFERDSRLISTVTLQKLDNARREEEIHAPISDPAVRRLRKHTHATSGRVMGSDQSRYQLRSQIWSTSIIFGPPTLWITINPTDLHDPIAQVFAGENIDLDHFSPEIGPNTQKRAELIAADPYAAAKFFHFIIHVILKDLFGVNVTNYQVHSRMGVLGEVSAYFGTVESQGRGTLHLHLLLWLKHSPNADDMVTMLKSSNFRDKIVKYIKANLRSYLPGLDDEESVKAIQVQKDIAYNQPPTPDSSDYDKKLANFELMLARSEQVHTCQIRRCLFLDKEGHYRCKRHAPFEVFEEDFVNENGKWGSKRSYEYINGWIPAILINVRCNNDGKLLTNGRDTRNVSFYTTLYSSKKQNRYENISAIMAKGYAYHLERIASIFNSETSDYVDDL